jgi:micrococcal nuclease
VLTPAACASAGEEASAPTSATVSAVADGDTLRLRGGARVRLVQIDAPELGGECYGRAAARELTRLAGPGRRVTLELDPDLDDVDRFGRALLYVHSGETNVNVELVRRGAATPYFFAGERGRYAHDLLSAVAAARTARRGLWGACRVRWTPDAAVETRPR